MAFTSSRKLENGGEIDGVIRVITGERSSSARLILWGNSVYLVDNFAHN